MALPTAITTNRLGGSNAGLAKLNSGPATGVGVLAPGQKAVYNGSGSVIGVQAPAAKKTTTSTASTSTAAPATDTTAQRAAAAAAAAEQARQAALIAQINAGFQGIQSSGQTGVRDLTNTYSTNNRNTVDSIVDTQDAINQSRTNTALNLRRGMADVINGVRQGFTQGRQQLAGMNATDSGATFDLARAYAGQANDQSSGLHNDAFLANTQTDQQQGQLNRQRDESLADFATYRSTEVDRISNDLYNQLRTLDANASAEGMGGRVDMGLRDRLINDAIAQLNAIDQQTSARLSTVNPYSADQATNEAARLYGGGGVGFQSPYRLVV